MRCAAFCALLLASLFYLPDTTSAQGVDAAVFENMEFRSVGPYRGGRSAAVSGVPGDPYLYYFGATGGGVWKTTDGGASWSNISDGYFGGSIGAVAVSTWDPNVIYVGGGEKTVRGNVSHGYGMWKSVDAGKTWTNIGLDDSRHISRIRIHPKNPDVVYAAVMGHLYGPNEERGVYRSMDGGATWNRIHYLNDEVGAVDLIMDPSNPRVLYASMWRVKRTPYSLESGGPGSGLWKSTDAGDTWTEVTGQDNGLPGGTLGIIGVTVSPANPQRVWAIVEANDGGVFRSEDGGESWRKINDDRSLRQRAWYYTRIYADPQNPDGVYVMNVGFWKSKDGGRTYERISTPHGDHHDLWINPDNPMTMAVADDGGAQVTFSGGQNWSTYYNQPTAQFYRVTTDNHFPYRIYGAQQDNSTVRILHTSSGSENDWEPTAGGESGWLAPHPNNPDIVYGGSYGGFLTRVNHATGERRSVNVWPDNPMGYGAKDLKYRFQWNFPILFSKHDPNTIYAAAQVLFTTTNEGQTWTAISPDLTRNDTTMMGSSGGPITKDNTSVEYYGTIFAVAEGHEPGVIWTGSDDGLLHITRDGGANWTDVTPPRRMIPEYAQINEIMTHPTEPGGLYVAATAYKLDDFAPYLYKTTDYGQTWTKITDGIDPLHFTRAIEPDPMRPGLLYAGTESGLYVSFDDGDNWQPFQMNLPIVPITDLAWKDNDLVVATQGRSFWILEDLTPLHQMNAEVASADHHLFTPAETPRMMSGGGIALRYHLADVPDSSTVALHILETDGTVITSFDAEDDLPLEPGLNSFTWNLRYADAETFPGMITWNGTIRGPRAVPGTYHARLVVGDDSTTVPFTLTPDPRASASQADLQAQFDFLMDARDKLTETNLAVKQIRQVRDQVNAVTAHLPHDHDGADAIHAAAEAMLDELGEVEKALYQTKNRSRQDPLNFPIRLNDKLAGVANVASTGAFRPTDQAYAVKAELTGLIDTELARMRDVLQNDLPAFNALVRENAVPAVILQD
ncbi:MAG: glycosyl hydrolase [Bacteroidota bacterium]